MENWNSLHIIDKNDSKYFEVTVSPSSTMSEIENMALRIEHAKKYPYNYPLLDVDSLNIILNGEIYPRSEVIFSKFGCEVLEDLGLSDERN